MEQLTIGCGDGAIDECFQVKNRVDWHGGISSIGVCLCACVYVCVYVYVYVCVCVWRAMCTTHMPQYFEASMTLYLGFLH